jgi:hypothetical protein
MTPSPRDLSHRVRPQVPPPTGRFGKFSIVVEAPIPPEIYDAVRMAADRYEDGYVARTTPIKREQRDDFKRTVQQAAEEIGCIVEFIMTKAPRRDMNSWPMRFVAMRVEPEHGVKA